MPIPPILEIYVVWHPADGSVGRWVADTLLTHFRSATYSGLVGGAVDVYVRSDGWRHAGGAPRPMPFVERLPHDLQNARFTAVVPVIGPGLSRAVNDDDGWRAYVTEIAEAARRSSSVMVFPLPVADALPRRAQLVTLLQSTAFLRPHTREQSAALCRSLAQEITRAVGDAAGDELQVFISHTKRTSPLDSEDDVLQLLAAVRARIAQAHRLRSFYDDDNVGPGLDFEQVLIEQAGKSALLVIRTDRFAGRAWCQREVVIAKRANMPVVTLYAVAAREERGSFLIDHVPSIPLARADRSGWASAIDSVLDQLVDEALKRALWTHQRDHLEREGFAWLPANAPEPLTIAPELPRLLRGAPSGHPVFVMHPDPPLGPAESELLDELSVLAGSAPGQIDVLTPRTFASRGGRFSS